MGPGQSCKTTLARQFQVLGNMTERLTDRICKKKDREHSHDLK